ncbi:MAG: arginine--tRNA ligase [Candidatus Marinimicrobia bacterium]|jgi:arginyl-tRNA synthetase|nr:arginine--tRNA ligase [Candidatus Neomarinimicrobiota bacterium]MBT4294375.1 arginine--tRNA ligase [Candidatus Neomarinimicrobiota bacterium]MBT5467128.1 arginine--tRNA ligase [Candidatus Neomarinimicrobiota bacterium]MBT6001997.1 arginine--tRNA ligase [Candidatus Neomarinimicrobiota bacterium]MBT6758317.1 arginine--tRNA ligase [Candidatus Neomarinimicrobiota bacterium]
MFEYLTSQLTARLEQLGWPTNQLQLARPKKAENGDWSSNIAMALARELKRAPMQIAEELMDGFTLDPSIVEKFEILNPGFINFFQSSDYLTAQISNILKESGEYGKSDFGSGQTAQVEFVSANPTGPLTVGHGRQTVLGDTLANILTWSGYDVTREYYFNNAGRQMRLLGESLKARYLELKGESISLPDGGYEGAYLIDVAKTLLKEQPELSATDDVDIFKSYAEKSIFSIIKGTLQRIGVVHDVFYNERSLYEAGKIDEVLDILREKGLLYDKDGATWFKTSELGIEQDRVLVKSSGEPTYRLPDIAYHREKVARGFDLVVDIFGADHIDAYPDVLSALKVMGLKHEHIEVVIHQFVTLLRSGEVVKMSTRKANFVTLDKLIDEVGADVVRYFYIMRSASSHLNFDLDLAKRQTEENPVFYLQYAHARISSIFRRAKERGLDSDTENADLTLLNEEFTVALINKTLEFPEVIDHCRRALEVHHLPGYLFELATALHKFYTEYKVIDLDKPELSKARLALLEAVQITLRNGLRILGISAPEQM